MASRGQLIGAARVATVALGYVAIATAFAGPAQAATDVEQAEALIREGVQLRSQDKAARALPLFEKAYQLSRTPRTAAQLGLCEMDLGYHVEAERYLTEALAAPDHPWVAKNKASLRKQLETARASIGELALTVSPAGADVSVNKKLIDKALLASPIRLEKGPVDVEVRAIGYQPASETLTIAGGKREQRTYALVAEPTQPLALNAVNGSASPASGGAAPSGSSAAATVTASSAPPSSPTDARRIAAWVTGGAAAGALAVGVVEALGASSKQNDFNNHTGVVGGVTMKDCTTANLSPACKPLKDSYDQALTFSIVGFAAAGALAAASAVLFVLSSSDHAGAAENAAAAHAFACVPDLSDRGVACSLRF